MAQQEICQIVEKERPTFSKTFWWWEAHQVTPQGGIVVAKSGEFTHPSHEGGCLTSLLEIAFSSLQDSNIKTYNERRRVANAQVVAQLLAKGWEVAAVNGEGLTTMVRRDIEHERSPSLQKPSATQDSEERKIIVKCENCGQKLSIPFRRKNLHVACPKCRHEFNYEYIEGNPVDD